MHIIQTTSQNDCTFGWYKTRERTKSALFSLPYYLDNANTAKLILAGHTDPRVMDRINSAIRELSLP